MNKLLRATALTSLLLGTSLAAMAADLPPAPPMAPRAPVAYIPAAPMFSWTGLYIGGNLGDDDAGLFEVCHGVGQRACHAHARRGAADSEAASFNRPVMPRPTL
jgi:hypothetical protein